MSRAHRPPTVRRVSGAGSRSGVGLAKPGTAPSRTHLAWPRPPDGLTCTPRSTSKPKGMQGVTRPRPTACTPPAPPADLALRPWGAPQAWAPAAVSLRITPGKNGQRGERRHAKTLRPAVTQPHTRDHVGPVPVDLRGRPRPRSPHHPQNPTSLLAALSPCVPVVHHSLVRPPVRVSSLIAAQPSPQLHLLSLRASRPDVL